MWLCLFLLALAAFANTSAYADVYKCPDGKGGTILRDIPCHVPREVARTAPVAQSPMPLPSLPPIPLQYMTRDDRIACLTPSWYAEMQRARVENNTREREYLLKSKQCFIPKPGLDVSVLSPVVWDALITIKVRLYAPDTSGRAIVAWMSGADIAPVPR